MNQRTIFDIRRETRAKASGMTAAEEKRRYVIGAARNLARSIARRCGTCNMDQVNEELEKCGIDPALLGNAAGSVFKGKEWKFTGERIKSAKLGAHAREIKCWRLAA